jgi:tetratricopeptide (TPR) repeat protein
MNSTLDQAIQRYEQAIALLTQSPHEDATSVYVLEILTARDFLQNQLENTPDKSGTQLEKIIKLDTELREQASAIAQVRNTAGETNNWLDSFKPNENAWWWFLEAPKPQSKEWLWNGASIVFLTAALTLVGDIAPRFIAGSPDLLSSFFVTAQGVFGLASAGSILKAFEGTAKSISKQSVVPLKLQHWQKLSLGFSAALMLATIGLRCSLPTLSNSYTQWGTQKYNNWNWSSAEADYQRALKLNPDNGKAHYWLGYLYEDLQNTDAARHQYQLAMQGQYLPAFNNFARLHILNNKASAAVPLLYRVLESEKGKKLEPEVKHAILKNLGWVKLQQKDYPGAELYLLDAIDLGNPILEQSIKLGKKSNISLAAPHCLLAQVKEAQKDEKSALEQWDFCVRYANAGNSDEDGWTSMAQQRLADAEKKKK